VTVIKAEHISKQYLLGQIGTGTLAHDLKRWWYAVQGKDDPFFKIGDENDRSSKLKSTYVWALNDLNFEINEGDVVGIIGKNGAGKSTLLKILSQITTPSSGSLKIKGRIAALLEVGTGFHPDLTGLENIYLNGSILGMQKSEIKAKLDEIIEFSGCSKYIDTPVKRYSSGMIVRLGFAIAAHLEPEILIVDEVLAVGDAEFQEKCIGKMKDISGKGRTIIFVSHNMASIKALCKRGILIDKGKIVFQGEINETIERYLATTTKTVGSGEIPAHASSINTGELKFKKILLLNEDNKPVDYVGYLSPLHFYLELDAIDDLQDSLIDIRINTLDGIELVHAMNKYDAISKGAFKKGHNEIHCTMNNHLQPGKYTVTIGIHQNNGTTMEYVENIFDFTVLNITKDDNAGFIYNFKLGHVRFESSWAINE
jgi:lipopolysaccharide transport system ATP-binding protein